MINAYLKYDCLITLGAEELIIYQRRVLQSIDYLVPMGISLDKWNYWSCDEKIKKLFTMVV